MRRGEEDRSLCEKKARSRRQLAHYILFSFLCWSWCCRCHKCRGHGTPARTISAEEEKTGISFLSALTSPTSKLKELNIKDVLLSFRFKDLYYSITAKQWNYSPTLFCSSFVLFSAIKYSLHDRNTSLCCICTFLFHYEHATLAVWPVRLINLKTMVNVKEKRKTMCLCVGVLQAMQWLCPGDCYRSC